MSKDKQAKTRRAFQFIIYVWKFSI